MYVGLPEAPHGFSALFLPTRPQHTSSLSKTLCWAVMKFHERQLQIEPERMENQSVTDTASGR